MKLTWRSQLPLLAILLAGTALRFFRLGAGSLWYDETVSVFLAGSPLPELIRHTAGDIHPPGYYLLLRGWLLLAGYPTGHADAHGQGLEFMAGFFSLFFGVLLIALVYSLACRLAGRGAGLAAAALVAFSPYNIWYSQEVRMYTLGAALGVVTVYAIWQATRPFSTAAGSYRWWLVYALAAAAGMYMLYYFAFLLIAVSIFALIRLLLPAAEQLAGEGRRPAGRRGTATVGILPQGLDLSATRSQGIRLIPWLLANVGAAALYTPWMPIAWRQATQPPVPPWRAATALGPVLRESWAALVAGQSAPTWLWPAVLLLVPIYLLGLVALSRAHVGNAGVHPHPNPGRERGLLLTEVIPSPLKRFPSRKRGLLLTGEIPSPSERETLAPHCVRRTPAPALRASAGAGGTGGVRVRVRRLDRSARCAPQFRCAMGLARHDSGVPKAASPNDSGSWLRLAALLAAPAALLALATFGALAVMMLASTVTPLYHVRYLFTYSPAFYIVLAAGLAWLWPRWRPAVPAIAALWLAAAVLSLHAFWYDPAFLPDDHRGAVAYLESRLRPGDAVLVNAGYAYTALATYWQGPVDWRGRLTADLPYPSGDNGLVLVTTGHINGAGGLGWADPRSDFFPLPVETARVQLEKLFSRFSRVWHYRIYDTVSDPQGTIRGLLASGGQLTEQRTFPGEAFLQVQSFESRSIAAPDSAWPAAAAGALELRAAPLTEQASSGQTIYPAVWWQPRQPMTGTLATSLRLVDANGTIWAQPPDEKPLGAEFSSSQWPAGHWLHQALALTIPTGTPPGQYQVELVPYDGATGKPLPLTLSPGGLVASPNGVRLGQVTIDRPQPEPALQQAQATFGPLALLQATSPAAEVKPGDCVPVELLWQAQRAPEGALVVVLQLLEVDGKVAASMEAQPLDGRYPAQAWEAGEIVRDRHTLELSKELGAGTYRLIIGLYQAADGQRFSTGNGPFVHSASYTIKSIRIRP